MNKQALRDFKRFWLKNYIGQYKALTVKERRLLKERLYKTTNLTDNEKDKIGETIVGGIYGFNWVKKGKRTYRKWYKNL